MKLRGIGRQRKRDVLVARVAEVSFAELVRVAAARTDQISAAGDLAVWDRRGEQPHLQCAQIDGRSLKAEADRTQTPQRRGNTPQPDEWEMLALMGLSSPGNEADSSASSSPDGVSAFIARVLDQLTLSAWLPAALLTASLAVLLQFRGARSVNVLKAVGALTANPIRLLVIMIPLLVIATVVTQAFSFEAIKTLEGYWRRRGLASKARTLMIQWHMKKKKSVTRRLHDAYQQALDVAKPQLLEKGTSVRVLNVLQAALLDEEPPYDLAAEEEEELDSVPWKSCCFPWQLAKIDQLLTDEESYPHMTRILPTRLGNLMRATEDQLENADSDLEGFVLRRYSTASRRVQMQHDQFRNRLDMYCTLVFVSAALVVLTPAVLFGSASVASIAIISASFALLSAASYGAAIASAGGYCAALKQMD